MRLFGRRVIVELGTEAGVGKRIEGLRVGFDVQMSDGSDPNKGRVEVFNAGRDTVAQMQQPQALVRLLVGYRSLGVPQLLFQGNPIAGGVSHDRSTGRLTIDAQDGGRVYRTSHISESYSTATTSGQLFTALAEAMGVPLGNVDAVVGSVSFPYGLALHGPVRHQLDVVADLSGARWQIRDGTLQVWPSGGTTGEEAILFSAENGNLIGSPAQTDEGVEVTALLAPSMRPGKAFRVESADVTGNFVASAVEFRGDSGFSREFQVRIKGAPL